MNRLDTNIDSINTKINNIKSPTNMTEWRELLAQLLIEVRRLDQMVDNWSVEMEARQQSKIQNSQKTAYLE